MLNPSEEIVTSWLHKQGFFVRNNLKVGQNEIDILAVNPIEMLRKPAQARIHCEISVQISPVGHVIAGSREPLEKTKQRSLKERVMRFHERKFIGKNGNVEKTVRRLLGGDYSKLFVCGNLNRYEKEEKDDLVRELEKRGVEIKFFSEILRELTKDLGKRGVKDNPSRYFQLIRYLKTSQN